MYIFGSLVKRQLSAAEIKDTEETSIFPIRRVRGCCCGGKMWACGSQKMGKTVKGCSG